MAREIIRAINNKTYDLDTVIDVRCSYRGMTVEAAIEKDRRCIMNLVKRYGLYFTDAVMERAHIKRTISNERVYNEFVERRMVAKPKVLKKDTESINKILDSLNVLSHIPVESVEENDDKTENEEEGTYIISTATPKNQEYDEDEEE